MIQVDINNDPNFLKTEGTKDPRDDSLLIFQQNEDNAIITEYFNQLCGISEAIDSVAVLEEIQEKLEANPEPDAGTLRIAQITVEHLCSSLKIENKGYSMESFASNRQAALEGLGSWISAFFEAIFKAIKSVIDWIADFFKPAQRSAREVNRKEMTTNVREKKSKGAKATEVVIKNKVFEMINPFENVSTDANLSKAIEEATLSVGCMVTLIKTFTVFLKEINKLYDGLTAANVEQELPLRDQAAITYNQEWNIAASKLAPHGSIGKAYEGVLNEIADRHHLTNEERSHDMQTYEGFVNGSSIVSYQRASTRRNYKVTHFEIAKTHDAFKSATGDYDIGEIAGFERVVNMVTMYGEESDKMGRAIDDMTDPLKHFLKSLEKVQDLFSGVQGFKPTPLLHIGKIIASQAASFQQAMHLVDQTGVQYERMVTVIDKHYKVS